MKKTLLAALCLLLGLTLCTCGEKADGAPPDLQAMAEELRPLCGEDLFALDQETIALVYTEGSWEEAVVYSSSGSTAEEIGLFRTQDESGAEELAIAAKSRLEGRALSYADYMPEEAEKLDQAVVEQEGCYVAVCVSGDSEKASQIIDQYFG